MTNPDFTNHVSNNALESLANADEKSRIERIKEIFIDYYVIDPDIFTLQMPGHVGTL